VTLSPVNTTYYPEQTTNVDDAVERISIWNLPKLVWVGTALFCANLLIGTGVLVTPGIATDVYGKEVHSAYVTSSKPSPFTETVDVAKHKVQLAAKIRPVSFVPGPQELTEPAPMESGSMGFAIPARTEPAVYTQNSQPADRSARIYNADRQYEVYQAVDVTPRRGSEKESKFAVIN
jgi:hypothetical protein